MKKPITVIVLVLSALLVGCATVPMAPAEDDSRAKSFNVDAGKSNIYVYRNETMGGAIAMPVTLNGKFAGKSAPNTYFMWTVEPGAHEITSLTENTSTITVDAIAGKNHFIWQEVKMGTWSAGSLLQEVSEQEGRAGVNECKLVASDI